ncbi:twin-arginine translocase TatA/TatE family subunit [Hyphomonas sp. FCG-A18]|uniref:twin-arginine translocase TatA/TatE family subunit n=1 Tax=Hyphomonas sp. FCG-A18 TaxID=3080019 RepID=UPI002B2F9403|nr:twin-arginine translocase TatA/TatE family subunit [Hyphomonas sp. FCG-A18]
MAPSWMQLLIVAVIALLLFGGRGRISSIMGDLAKGIKSFRKGLSDEDEAAKKAVEGEDMVNITPEKDKSKTTS